MTTAEDQFRDAISAAGLSAPDTIEIGRFHRFPGDGKRNGNQAGWCRLFADGQGGVFGDFSTGLIQSWQAKRTRPLSLIERDAFQRNIAESKAQAETARKEAQAEAQQRARAIWDAAAPAPANHPYLARKAINPHGLRIYDGDLVVRGMACGGALIVPLRDGVELQTLEFIAPDGAKRFLPGGAKRGAYCAIGKPNGVLCLAEGFATAASIHEATGHAVAAAMDAGNLEPVARKMRERFPELRLIVCADDDWKTEGNPGVTKATEAAAATGGYLALPEFGPGRADSDTDFNDCAPDLIIRAVGSARLVEVSTPQLAVKNATAANLEGRIWPDPQPIRAELQPVPAFDADALLPESLRRWVIDEANRMPCPPDFVAATAIVGLGAAIGARCAIKPKARDSWMVVPNLWGGVVALPSAKKSPAIGAGMKPLTRLAAKASEMHQAEAQAFESDRLVSDARRDALKDDIKSAARKADGNPEEIARALQDHNASAPTAPKLRRFSTNDSTVEKLGELLRDNPSGLLVLRDELVGLLASWDREGREGDRAFFLEAWNGNGGFDTDRIGRGSISIPNLCLSVFGGIQPDKLTGYLEQAADALGNDGMLQRFQFLLYPDPCPWEWRDIAPDAEARDAVMRVFEILADFDPVSWGAVSADAVNRFPHFRFDEGAQAVFVEWATELHRVRIPREQAEGHPLIAQHLAKYEKAFAAIALIVHLAECASTGLRGAVSESAAIRAAAWCEFLEAHARRCYGLLADQGARAAQSLAYRIRAGALSDGFTARDVRRKQWRHLGTDSAVRDALEWLEGEHWVTPIVATEDATGRPTIRYAVNPKSRKGGGIPTAITAESGVSSVLAVPVPGTFAGNGALHG